MSDEVRTALLAMGLAFCILFGAVSLAAIVDYWGTSPRHVFAGFLSLGIVALIGFGLWGAIRNPPRR